MSKMTRREATALIEKQLNNETPADKEKSGWHYGKKELRELMDAIYGGVPACDEEKIK